MVKNEYQASEKGWLLGHSERQRRISFFLFNSKNHEMISSSLKPQDDDKKVNLQKFLKTFLLQIN